MFYNICWGSNSIALVFGARGIYRGMFDVWIQVCESSEVQVGDVVSLLLTVNETPIMYGQESHSVDTEKV